MFGTSVRWLALLTGAFAVMTLISGRTEAGPLPKEACKTLEKERVALVKQGVDKAIINGPEWTRANMSPETMELARRYLTVEEKLYFRCPGTKIPILAAESAGDGDAKTPGSEAKNTEKRAALADPVPAEPKKDKADKFLKAGVVLPLKKPEPPEPEPAPLPDVDLPQQKPVSAKQPAEAEPPGPKPEEAAEKPETEIDDETVAAPDRKPTQAERAAYAQQLVEARKAAARAAQAKKEKESAPADPTQTLLLSIDGN